jgi:SAM-dependent methyltransferase
LGIHLKSRAIPIFLALIIQAISLFIASILLNVAQYIVVVLFGMELHFSLWFLILFVSILATILTYVAGMEIWWRWMQACLPIALYLFNTWHIGSWVYLIAFVTSLSLFWTVAFTQVPFYPSRTLVWQKLVSLIPAQSEARVLEIGSGLGDAAMYVARLRPNSQATGIEIAPLPWIVSMVRAWCYRSTAIFKWGDYRTLDFSQYDLVFAYLSPAVMTYVWEKAKQEMRPGSLLVSYEFGITGVPPTRSISLGKHDAMLYVWKIGQVSNFTAGPQTGLYSPD